MPRSSPFARVVRAAALLAALALSAPDAQAIVGSGTLTCTDGSCAQSCGAASVVGTTGSAATSCQSTLPSGVAINGSSITAGSFDAGSATLSRPAVRSATLPGTCVEGELYQDTDSGGSETYVCTATNTWTKLDVAYAFESVILGATGINAKVYYNASSTPVRVEVWPQATDKPNEGAAGTAGTIAWAEAQLTAGGEIFLHNGTYNVSTTITLDVAGTTLRCADPQTTTIKPATNFNSILLKVGWAGAQRQGMQVIGCGFDGNPSNQSTSGTLIALKDTADARIEGNYVRYWKTLGLTMACALTSTSCVDNMVARNNFYSSGGSGNTAGSAIFLDTNSADGATTWLTDGHISDNDIGGDNSNGDRVSGWIRLGDGTTDDSTNGWAIQGNHVYGADRGACIEIADKTSSLIDISNNTLESCNVGAVKWKGNAAGSGGLSQIQNNKMYGFTGRCSAGTLPIGTQCAVASQTTDCGSGGVCTLPNIIDFDRVIRTSVTGNRIQSQAGGAAAFIALRDSAGSPAGSNNNLVADNKIEMAGVAGEKGIVLSNTSTNNTISTNQCRTNTGSNGTCVDGGSIGGNRFFSNSCVNVCAAVETGIAAYSATTIHDLNTSVGDVGDFTCTSGVCTIDAGVMPPLAASYITATADGTLTNEFALGSLATGILKNTTTTGIPTIAVSNTDYAAAVHASRHSTGGADPLSGNIAANAATATALAADGGNCTLPNVALGVDQSGVGQCAQPSNVTGTAAALAANGGNCSADKYALGVDASGVAECSSALAAGQSWVGATATPTDIATQAELDAVAAAKVTGPASAVDNDLVVFDSTTGKLVKDSAVKLTTGSADPTGACSPVGSLFVNTTTGVLSACAS